jgi:aromatic ring-opening dioxygenase catalytic subunit (LigB family)
MNRFVDELTQVLTKSDGHERENILINWEEKLLYSRLNHLREEHFIPLHIIVGAAGSDRGELLNPNIEKQEAAYKFGI